MACFNQIKFDDCRGYESNFHKFVGHVQKSISEVIDDKGALDSLLSIWDTLNVAFKARFEYLRALKRFVESRVDLD